MSIRLEMIRAVVVMVLFTSASLSSGQETPANIDILIDQKIRMADGVHLSANIYKPDLPNTRFPAVVAYTSYAVGTMHKDAMFFARHGYVYLGVNARGRNSSEGSFFPYEDAGRDGFDLMAWIAKQSWSDGQVGMVGVSYPAFTQWQTLKFLPPALKTIIPSAPTYPGIHSPYALNILSSLRIQWGAIVHGKEMNMDIYLDSDYWNDLFYRRYEQHIPFAQLAKFAHGNETWWEKWVAHPNYDEYWQSLVPTAKEYAGIDIPILQISGYFDGSLLSTVRYYREHMEFGAEKAKKNHYLIIGPWSHGGTRHNHSEHEGLQLGSKSILYPDMMELWLQWLDWTLKGKGKPKFLEKQVNYFVMNADTWRHVDHLDDISDQAVTLYLSSTDGRANDIFHSGELSGEAPRSTQKPDHYLYDPLELAPRQPPSNDLQISALMSQVEAFAKEKLIYHTAPFTEDLEIAGTPVLKAYIELDVPDTDFSWHLYEITRDGVSIELGQSILRARFRNSLSVPELVKPGEVTYYEMPMWALVVRKISKGSRLRLVFTSLNSPYWQKNYNSGGDVSYETAADARTAHVKLYHDKSHPSALFIPVRSPP